eukprot:scaffold88896_cov73-Cyclotella_meneghiniana.AAC.2
MSHHGYDEWFGLRLDIIVQNHHHTQYLLSHRWSKLLLRAPTFHTKIECVWTDSSISHQLDPSNTPKLSVFGLIQAFHIRSTLPMSYLRDDEWFDMVEIGYHCPKSSPRPTF